MTELLLLSNSTSPAAIAAAVRAGLPYLGSSAGTNLASAAGVASAAGRWPATRRDPP
jgi:peptidase E